MKCKIIQFKQPKNLFRQPIAWIHNNLVINNNSRLLSRNDYSEIVIKAGK